MANPMKSAFRVLAAVALSGAVLFAQETATFTYDGPAFRRGLELVNQKKYAEAAAQWREVLQQQPGNPGAYYYAGVGRYELGELDKAAYNFKRAFDYPDKGFNAWYYLGRIAAKQGRTAEARANYEKYLSLTQSANGIAEVKGRLARLPQAEKPAAAEAAPAPAPEKAAEAAPAPAPEKAAEAAPSKPEAPAEQPKADKPKVVVKSLAQADAEYRKGNLEAAEAGYLEFLKGSPKPEDAAWAWYQLGNLYRGWRHDDALAAYDKVISLYPRSSWAPMARWKKGDVSWKFDHQNLVE